MKLKDAILGSSIIFGVVIVFSLLLLATLITGFVYAKVNKNIGNKVLTSEQCFLAGGSVRSSQEFNDECPKGESILAEVVEGINCPCLCCKK